MQAIRYSKPREKARFSNARHAESLEEGITVRHQLTGELGWYRRPVGTLDDGFCVVDVPKGGTVVREELWSRADTIISIVELL